MSREKIKELKSLSKDNLRTKLDELQRELMRENAQIASGTTPKNPGMVRQTKKMIARVLMYLDQESKKALTQQVQGTGGTAK